MQMPTARHIEMEIASVSRANCKRCGGDKLRAVTFESMTGVAIIETACSGCALHERISLEWKGDGLHRCPACLHAFPAGQTVIPASFDWPMRCYHCQLRFVDARYPYKLQLLRPDCKPQDLAFSRQEQFDEALLWCEKADIDHTYRGLHWRGGSVRLSEEAMKTWDKTARKPVGSAPQSRSEWDTAVA